MSDSLYGVDFCQHVNVSFYITYLVVVRMVKLFSESRSALLLDSRLIQIIFCVLKFITLTTKIIRSRVAPDPWTKSSTVMSYNLMSGSDRLSVCRCVGVCRLSVKKCMFQFDVATCLRWLADSCGRRAAIVADLCGHFSFNLIVGT